MTSIFISYKSEYRSFAEKLYHHLDEWGFNPWLDVFKILPGQDWGEAIHKGLRASDVVVALMTPEALESEMVMAEWHWALVNNRPIIPLRLKQIPTEDISPLYIRIQYINAVDVDEAVVFERLRVRLSEPITIYQSPVDIKLDTAQKIVWQDTPRHQILEKVYEFWIDGVLQKALHTNEKIHLELESRPDALVRFMDGGQYAFKQDTSVLGLFRDSEERLLILGDPGSGKSFTLLELCRDLIYLAKDDEKARIPMVFNLSSWANTRQALDKWLIDEMRGKYRIPRKTAWDWLKGYKLIALLDGLDEIRDIEVRGKCVDAINTFQQDYKKMPLVVCSRIKDYEVLTEKLDLNGAFVLQPLTEGQIEHYLQHPAYQGLRTVAKNDGALKDMMSSPFLLNIMRLTYRDMSETALAHAMDDEQGRSSHLFNKFIDNQFLSYAELQQYNQHDSRKFLSWLAYQMQKHSLSIFHIEDIDMSWLSNNSQQVAYTAIAGSIASAAIGIMAGTANGLFFGRVLGFDKILPIGIGTGVVLTLTAFFTFLYLRKIAAGLAFAVAFGIVVATINGSAMGVAQGLLTGLVIAVFLIPLLGVVFTMQGGWSFERERIVIFDALHWSWRRAIVGTLTGLLVGITGGLLYGYFNTLNVEGTAPIFEGLAFGIVAGVVFGITNGLFGSRVDMKIVPNQGIWSSARNAFLITMAVGVTNGILLGLIFALFFSPLEGVMIGVGSAMLGVIGLFFGGVTVIQHATLRYVLSRQDYIPKNYTDFLDFAADLMILRKVGGGYIFRHRMLQEYLASQYTDSA